MDTVTIRSVDHIVRTTTESVRVRTATDADDLDAVNFGNPLWTGAVSERERLAALPPERPYVLLIGEIDGAAAGSALGVGAPVAAFGYGMARIYVQSAYRRRGLGTALFERAAEMVREAGRPGVMVLVPDEDPDGVVAANARGLSEHGHQIESVLALDSIDDAEADRELFRAGSNGFALRTLDDAATEQDWQRAYTAFLTGMVSAPNSRGGGGQMPYAVFRTFIAEPWQILLAYHQDEVVGLTSLSVRRDVPGRLNTVITAVGPSSRGRGLSLALKLEHARRARRAGWREIVTQNMDGNEAILAVNRKMGFRPVGGAYFYGLGF